MIEGRSNASETRQRNFDRRAEAQAKTAESKAQIMEVLAQISTDSTATIEQNWKRRNWQLSFTIIKP